MGRIEKLVGELDDPAHRSSRRYAAISLCHAIQQAEGAEREDVERCAVVPLSRLLSEVDTGLQADAIKALRAVKDKGISIDAAVPAMAKAAVRSKSNYVRIFATEMIGSLVERMPELAPVLLKAVQDEGLVVASKALYQLAGVIRRCDDRRRLEDMRAELNYPGEARRARRETCLRDLKELNDRKERRAMRKAIGRRFGDVRETDEAKIVKKLITIRICELDHPTLKPKRPRLKFWDLAKKLRLKASTAL